MLGLLLIGGGFNHATSAQINKTVEFANQFVKVEI